MIRSQLYGMRKVCELGKFSRTHNLQRIFVCCFLPIDRIGRKCVRFQNITTKRFDCKVTNFSNWPNKLIYCIIAMTQNVEVNKNVNWQNAPKTRYTHKNRSACYALGTSAKAKSLKQQSWLQCLYWAEYPWTWIALHDQVDVNVYWCA